MQTSWAGLTKREAKRQQACGGERRSEDEGHSNKSRGKSRDSQIYVRGFRFQCGRVYVVVALASPQLAQAYY